jgi:hypothetical protein
MMRSWADGRKQLRAAALSGTALLALLPAKVQAEDYTPLNLGRNTFGEVGLLDTPSSRMARDGQIALTIGALRNTQRINFTFQVLPWLEGSFRYSHLQNFGSTGNYFDRSFGLKMRLFQETDYLPEVSLGIRDLIGTGIYGDEYVVGSKRIGDVDLSAGIGWGRFADTPFVRNPFCKVAQSFCVRKPFSGPGGQVDFGNFFHGQNVGLFGGAIWHTPIDGLDLIAEYSGDKYKREVAFGNMKWKMPGNFGISYHVFDVVSLSAGWLYGTTWTAMASITIDPTRNLFPVRVTAPPLPPTIRSANQQEAALTDLINPNQQVQTVAYTSAPVEPTVNKLAQALMSETGGVHDFEVDGTTLVLNVNQTRTGRAPNCEPYLRVVRLTRPDLHTIAITNLNDPNADIAVCDLPGSMRTAQLRPISMDSLHLTGFETLAQTQTSGSGATPLPAQAKPSLEQRIRTAALQQGLEVEAMRFDGAQAIVYYRNKRYYSEPEGVGRLSRILMGAAPANVEIFKLILLHNGLPVREFTVARSALERAATVNGASAEIGEAIDFNYPGMNNPLLDRASDQIYPRVSWSLYPRLRQSVFDPKSPYKIELLASGKAAVEILPGLTAATRIEAKVFDTFGSPLPSNSLLPHVRSDNALYIKKGANGISYLKLTYQTRLAPDIFAEVRGGLIEDMFAGVGGQVLWRPENSRIAVGADIYQVWQRGFDRLFNLQNYSVTTGHVSVYYQSPWHGMNFNIHVGRYLAGDYGATFEVTRRFSTGVEIGAYATFTNVPFAKFGEGSFDKGIMVRVPLEWLLPTNSTTVVDWTLHSLTRDGGQRIEDDDSLYGDTIPIATDQLSERLNDVTNP